MPLNSSRGLQSQRSSPLPAPAHASSEMENSALGQHQRIAGGGGRGRTGAAFSRVPSHGSAGLLQPPWGRTGRFLLGRKPVGAPDPPAQQMRRRCPGLALPGDRAGGTRGGEMGRGCLRGPTPPLTGADSPIASCSWDRKNNPEPWNKLGPTDQYKVSTGVNWGGLALWGGGHGHLSGTSTTLCLGKRREQHQPWAGGRGAQALECPHPCSYPSPFQFMAVSTDYKSLKKDRPSF